MFWVNIGETIAENNLLVFLKNVSESFINLFSKKLFFALYAERCAYENF